MPYSLFPSKNSKIEVKKDGKDQSRPSYVQTNDKKYYFCITRFTTILRHDVIN